MLTLDTVIVCVIIARTGLQMINASTSGCGRHRDLPTNVQSTSITVRTRATL